MNVFKDKAGPPPDEVAAPVRRHGSPLPLSGQPANVVPLDASDTELLEALRKLGDDILQEPTPQPLIDILRRTSR